MLNIVVHEGRLAAEPKFFPADPERGTNDFVTFRLGVERDYKVNNEKVVDWFTYNAYGATARFIHTYYHTGDTVIVVGSLQNQADRNEPNKYYTYVYVNKTYPARLKSNKDNAVTQEMEPQIDDGIGVIQPEDIPDNGCFPENIDDELLKEAEKLFSKR